MNDKYYYVFDSYDHSKKTLPIGQHKICYAKRIVLYKKDPTIIHRNFLEILKAMVKLLQGYVSILSKNMGEVIGNIFSKRN